MAICIQRLFVAKERLGISRSTFYLQVSQGLITKPINVGLRAVGWPSDEIEAILNARITGKSIAEIKAMVADLESRRAGRGAA